MEVFLRSAVKHPYVNEVPSRDCLPSWIVTSTATFCDPKGKTKRITEISTLTSQSRGTNVTNHLFLNFNIC